MSKKKLKRAAIILLFVAALIAKFFVIAYPSYGPYTISFEHWPNALLVGLFISVVLGYFQYTLDKVVHRTTRNYDDRLIMIIDVTLSLIMGKALIDDVGDAWVYFLREPSGLGAIIALVLVVSLYGFVMYGIAKFVSEERRKKLKNAR